MSKKPINPDEYKFARAANTAMVGGAADLATVDLPKNTTWALDALAGGNHRNAAGGEFAEFYVDDGTTEFSALPVGGQGQAKDDDELGRPLAIIEVGDAAKTMTLAVREGNPATNKVSAWARFRQINEDEARAFSHVKDESA